MIYSNPLSSISLAKASASSNFGKTPIKNKAPDSKKDASTKTNDRIDANIPTDSVLYRHYETMINAELNSLLDHN